MIEKPMDILRDFPVRKTKQQKQSFRSEISSYLTSIGYEAHIESGKLGSKNIVFGSPESAQYLITAHYDTPAALPFPNLITPCSILPFIGYQAAISLLMFLIALIPGLILVQFGIGAKAASSIWLLSLYVILTLMLIGPSNKHNANDNTSGVVTLLEIAKSMPEMYRDRVCFILFDLEEAGLIGSSSYRKLHKAQTDKQLVLNLDCVGDGDSLMMFPTKKLLGDASKIELLKQITGQYGKKSVGIRDKGFAHYPSDQKHFPYGVGIAAFHSSSWAGLYCSRIHTKKDTILEETNVNILRAAIVSLITCGAVTRKENWNETV